MGSFAVRSISKLKGELTPLGDKSIAHRAVMCGALSFGKTRIENFPANDDCLATISAFKKLGIKISRKGNTVIVYGKGPGGLKKPGGPLFLGESGTTCRLMLGILSGQGFPVVITAGRSLSRRPMLRVTRPLRMMGAVIKARCKEGEEYLPLRVKGGRLKGITYKIPVASAQVKSAILLAGLFAEGDTSVIEPVLTRDHTERMLKQFGAGVKVKGGRIILSGRKRLSSLHSIYIPADISGAAFFMVLAALIPGSFIRIKNVSLNPARIGVITVLRRMGANIKIKYAGGRRQNAEPMGDLAVKSGSLKGTVVKKSEVPSLIDELPVLMVAACFARGRSVFKGVAELRVKETDRIRSMVDNLRSMGADIKSVKKGASEDIILYPKGGLSGAGVKSFGDHRTAMSMIVAGSLASGRTTVDDISCISKSFPNFISLLSRLKA